MDRIRNSPDKSTKQKPVATSFIDFLNSHTTVDGASQREHSSRTGEGVTFSLPIGSMSENLIPVGRQMSLNSSDQFHQSQDRSEDSDDVESENIVPFGNTLSDGHLRGFGDIHEAIQDGSDLGSRTDLGAEAKVASWSEMKTKAGKDRKRLPLACVQCRRKKIRCSGEKPTCVHCSKSRTPCVYKVTTRKAAPRTDYMGMLDKRLKRMEERIIKIVPKKEQNSIILARAQIKPSFSDTNPSQSLPSKKRGTDEAFGADFDPWADAKVITESEGGGADMSSSLLAQEAEEGKLLSEGFNALPSQEIQEHLAEVYFESLHGQAYHLLHKPSFMRKLRARTVPPVLILAVCAISARFSTHSQLQSDPPFLRGEIWASVVRDCILKRYDWPNITILTCLLLLGLHEFGTCFGGRSWALGGMAIRMAYALQLHKDLEFDPLKQSNKTQLSFIDREIRRRSMWSCFLMDRFNSSGTDRPMFIREESIKIQLPIKEHLFQLDMAGPTEDLHGNTTDVSPDKLQDINGNMGVAAYMIRAIALWGRVIIYLFQGGKELDGRSVWDPEAKFVDLDRQADDFPNTLPELLRFSKQSLDAHETEGLSNQFLFLHIASQQSKLFLNYMAVHGHPGGRPPKDIPRDFMVKSTAKALEAAAQISALLKFTETHLVSAPFAGYCAFMSSVVQMSAVFSKNPAIESVAKQNLATNVRYLSKMKRYWGAFHWTSEHLKDHFKSCADATRKGSDEDQEETQIYQYGDWFDRYPHGVSQIDFEGPATSKKKEKGSDAVLEQKSNYQSVEQFFHTLPATTPAELGKSKKKSKKASHNGLHHNDNRRRASGSQGISPPSNAPQFIDSQQPSYQPMSIHDPILLGQQPISYGNDLLFPAYTQGMLPQLDRQLVFGAYTGIGPAAELLDNNWNGEFDIFGAYSEPTSAWFMPFNMEPPQLNPDFTMNAMSTAGGYGGGMMMATNEPIDGMQDQIDLEMRDEMEQPENVVS